MGLLELLLAANPKALDMRYREREAFCETSTPPVAVRLDGVGFGKRLKDFPAPRSPLVHAALVETAKSLASTHGADVAHVVSDEINLLFLGAVPYGGRTFKMISVLAAQAAAELSTRLSRPLYFDGRVVKLEDKCDAARYLLYRARIGFNNYLVQIARARGAVREQTPRINELLKTAELDNYELAWGTVLSKERKYAPLEPTEALKALCPSRT
ncbi:MAG: tRNA(His) guanylyltransferase Thg1 family protein [Pyrobaculum sp.]